MQRWLRNHTRAGTCARLTPRLPDSLGADAVAKAPCPRGAWRRGGRSKAGERQGRKGWKRHEPLEQIPHVFPTHWVVARSLQMPGRRHLRGREGCFHQLLVLPFSLPPQEMGLPGRQHLVLPCKPRPDHKATLTLANRHIKRTCVTGS